MTAVAIATASLQKVQRHLSDANSVAAAKTTGLTGDGSEASGGVGDRVGGAAVLASASTANLVAAGLVAKHRPAASADAGSEARRAAEAAESEQRARREARALRHGWEKAARQARQMEQAMVQSRAETMVLQMELKAHDQGRLWLRCRIPDSNWLVRDSDMLRGLPHSDRGPRGSFIRTEALALSPGGLMVTRRALPMTTPPPLHPSRGFADPTTSRHIPPHPATSRHFSPLPFPAAGRDTLSILIGPARRLTRARADPCLPSGKTLVR